MLTRVVWLSLLVELAAWLGIAAWLHSSLGIAWPALAAGIVVGVLAARFAFVCLTILLAWFYRSPRLPAQRLGPVGVARLVASEYAAVLRDNLWYLPFSTLAVRPDPPHNVRGRTPVVLVHGYLSNRGYWASMVRRLEERGVTRLYVPTYRAMFSTMQRSAAELHEEIERIAAGGAPRVVLVCHSMGGLLARQYLQDHGAARIARIVTIASPHHGTELSRFGVGGHAWQMRPGSAYLTALAAAEAAAPPSVPATSIYSVHDNLVSPQDTSRLPWARNVAVAGVGHLGLLSSEQVFALVFEELRAAAVA